MLSESLRQTINHYRIPLADIADKVQLTEARISQIKNGSPCSTRVLERILNAMEILKPGSRDYFFLTCISENKVLELLLGVLQTRSLTDLEVSEIMLVLSDKVI